MEVLIIFALAALCIVLYWSVQRHKESAEFWMQQEKEQHEFAMKLLDKLYPTNTKTE